MTVGLSFFVPASMAEDAVTFNFAWPSDVQADIVWRMHSVDDSYGEIKEATNTFRFAIMARPLPDGIRVDQAISVAQGLQNFASQIGTDRGGSLRHWLFIYPSFSVGSDGQFRGLEDVETYRASVEVMLKGIGRNVKRLTPEQIEKAKALIRHGLSPEVIGPKVATDWNTVISNWNGGTLELGQVLEFSTTLQYPIGGQVLTVPQVERYRLVGYAQCEARDGDRRCVEVEATFVPDADAMRVMYDRAIAESMQGLMPNGREPPRLRSAFFEFSVRMITDPRTLLPYRIKFVDVERLRFVEPEEGHDTINRNGEITIEFMYRG